MADNKALYDLFAPPPIKIEPKKAPLMEFSLKDLTVSTVAGAGIGTALGAPAGPPGMIAGGVRGGIAGFTSYVAGYFGARSLQGLFDLSDKQAETVRRAIELFVPVGYAVKTPQFVVKMAQKFPTATNLLKTGFKVGSFALATGYIAEPYVRDENSQELDTGKLLGVSALAGTSFVAAKRLAPLGVWLGVATRQAAKGLTEGKWSAGVIVDPKEAWHLSVKGRDIYIPKVSVSPTLQVKIGNYTDTKDILLKTKEEVGYEASVLDRVLDTFDKLGIKAGTDLSQKIGKLFYDKPFKEAIEELDKIDGLTKEQLTELRTALAELQYVSLTNQQFLVKYGLANKDYLELLGGDRLFQHIFVSKEKPYKSVQGFVSNREYSPTTPSVSSKRFRGKFIPKKKAIKSLDLPEVIEKKLMKNPPEQLPQDDGIYKKLKLGNRIYYVRDVSLEEVGGIADISASVLKTISEDTRLIRRLMVYDWMRQASGHLISDRPIKGWLYLKSQPKKTVKTWGTLSGKYVHPELFYSLRGLNEMFNYKPASLFWKHDIATLNYRWKTFYLSLNYKSYINALLGNTVLSFVNGFSPSEVVVNYFKNLNNTGLKSEAERYGVFKSALSWEQLATREKKQLDDFIRMLEQKPKGKVRETLDWLGIASDTIAEKLYGRIDEVYRFGLYAKLRNEGVSPKEASRLALETFGYYGDMPVIARKLRDTIFPFISFSLRITPVVAQSFFKYPERYALILATMEGLKREALKEMYGDDWLDGYRYEEAVKPAFVDSHLFGLVGDFVRTPSIYVEETGEYIPNGLMSTNFLPWNMPLSLPHINTNIADTGYSYLATAFLQNPILRFASGLFLNIDPATGRTIFDQAGVDRPTASLISNALQSVIPSGATFKYAMLLADGWFDPITHWLGYFGTYPDGTQIPSTHLAYNLLLPSVMKVDPKYDLKYAFYRLKQMEDAKRLELKRAKKRGTEYDVISTAEELEQLVDENWKKKVALIELYRQAKH